MNVYGRTFHRGKSIEKYRRSLIIDDILSGGRNVSTEYYPLTGTFGAIGSKYKVSGVTSFKRIRGTQRETSMKYLFGSVYSF